MSLFKVYYINLDKSILRREFMELQFKKLNISITRMPAVYGKELHPLFLKKAKSQHNLLTHYPNLNDGEIGLIKTYFDLWKIVARQEEDFAVILEDDALVNENFPNDLKELLHTINDQDFVDISGTKGFYKISSNHLTTKYLVPSLRTTGQIIGKKAAIKMSKNLTSYCSPIDVIKQDVFKHQTQVLTTNKSYVSSNDKNIGGSTIQQKKMPQYKKIIREVIRPIWQLVALLTYKPYRIIKNYAFYKSL